MKTLLELITGLVLLAIILFFVPTVMLVNGLFFLGAWHFGLLIANLTDRIFNGKK